MAVATDDTLDAAWEQVSIHSGVVVDVEPEPMRQGSKARHFVVFIPGGIRLELATSVPRA